MISDVTMSDGKIRTRLIGGEWLLGDCDRPRWPLNSVVAQPPHNCVAGASLIQKESRSQSVAKTSTSPTQRAA
jgi:hypothetical protein